MPRLNYQYKTRAPEITSVHLCQEWWSLFMRRRYHLHRNIIIYHQSGRLENVVYYLWSSVGHWKWEHITGINLMLLWYCFRTSIYRMHKIMLGTFGTHNIPVIFVACHFPLSGFICAWGEMNSFEQTDSGLSSYFIWPYSDQSHLCATKEENRKQILVGNHTLYFVNQKTMFIYYNLGEKPIW
jgi:hypothetical protein